MAEAVKKSPKFNIGALRKSLGSNSFADAKYKKPNYWLDTGCYAINRIMSGNTKCGIPGGRLTGIAGESQTCKSMIAARAIKSAQEQGIKFTFYLDTEGGALYEYMDQLGINGEEVEQIIIESAEHAVSTMIQIFDTIAKYQEQDPTAKFLIIFDSLGNLRSKKLYTDGLKGDSPIDMGGVARRIGDMVSFATPKALTTDTAVILLNHVYENPGEMMPQKIKSQYGGHRVIYMCRYLLQLTKVFRKAEKLFGNSDSDTFFNGSEVSVFCTKNASVRPFFEAKMLNNFYDPQATKYYGLFEVAESYGLIVRESSMYKIPAYSGDKKWYAKDIIGGQESDEIWKVLMPLIDEKSEIDMAFGSTNKTVPGLVDMPENQTISDMDPNSTSHMSFEQ